MHLRLFSCVFFTHAHSLCQLCPLLNPLLLIFGIFAFALSFVGRVVLPRILISATITLIFDHCRDGTICLFGLCVCFSLAFWKKLFGCGFCILRSGIKGTPSSLIWLVLLDAVIVPFYVHFHLCVVSCRCCASFSSYLLCNYCPFPEYPYLSCCSTFQAQIIAYLLFARNSKLTLLRHRHCCTFVVVPRLSVSTQLAIRSWGFCRCFADKVGFGSAAPTSELCVPQLGILLFVRPMFKDLSLRITQSRRNAQF